VGEKPERPCRGNPGVELADRARSSIARVGKGGEPGFIATAVQLIEVRAVHEHFASHVQERRCGKRATPGEPQRNRLYGPHVRSDIFAGVPVAPRRSSNEDPVFVHQLHSDTVQLGFDHVRDIPGGSQPSLDPGVELDEFLFFEDVGEGQHGLGVGSLAEFLQRLTADPLRGGIGCHQVRILCLELLQLSEQHVVLTVGDLRPIHDVVEVIVAPDLRTELFDFPRTLGRHLSSFIRACCHENSCPRHRDLP